MMASLLNEGAPTGGDQLVEQGAVPAAVRTFRAPVKVRAGAGWVRNPVPREALVK